MKSRDITDIKHFGRREKPAFDDCCFVSATIRKVPYSIYAQPLLCQTSSRTISWCLTQWLTN